ncbi:hypothetical protein F3J27_14740 [Enterobacter sp. Ap-916]|uniref:hypothetical protein n=1 Tax=Enterobacteriaceae TaxID=543 RepID=UPI00141FE9D5|nr:MULTISPECIES: hypothetical protein [unclassified Enterobacter]NIF59537.1 hypothetical protein [Enterobacter sp. Ap-867]NIG30737.1 hypothetical protein [Enterobacter sp. Ap-916]
MLKRIIPSLLLMLGFYTGNALAVDCQRAARPLENTICNNDTLHWLDSTMGAIYRSMLVKGNGAQVHKDYLEWEKSLENCTTDGCIERAYYEGISRISGVKEGFDWQGTWWNITAANRSGGKLTFSRNAEWSLTLDIRAWAGINHDDFTAEAQKIYGMVIVEKVQSTSNCKLLLIPRQNGSIQVHSNGEWGCKLSMPVGVFVDGRYVKSAKDPRPKATLLSIGIFPDVETDNRFREMVGNDYQNFVDAANVYIYQDDIDNIGAKVIAMWVRGEANRHTAIIMYTPEGKMWAARTSPGKKGGQEAKFYRSKSNEADPLPRTIRGWKLRFLDK